MEPKDIYYAIAAISIVVTGIIAVVASHFTLKSKIDLETQRSDQLHERLKEHESEFKEHSSKVEKKLEDLGKGINEVKILIERNAR
jgi:hypothetical protein